MFLSLSTFHLYVDQVMGDSEIVEGAMVEDDDGVDFLNLMTFRQLLLCKHV